MAEDIEESLEFYEGVIGMERIPTPDFRVETEWLRCGDQQLHLWVDEEVEPSIYFHFGVHVDDFEAVYREAKERDIFAGFGEKTAPPRAFELPDGSIQMYIRDPAGNLVEVDHHDVTEIDRSVVTNIVTREAHRADDGANTGVYVEGFFE